MAANPAYSTLHNGQSESDLEFERFEHLASPCVSVHRRASDAEMGLPETDSITAHTHDPQTDTETKQAGFDWDGSWAWEVGSVALAVVGLALLVAFLVKIDNAPYTNWQYTASPNTVVSVIVTVTKTALLVSVSSCLGQLKWNLFQTPAPLYHMQALDQASRGPWGSLEILLRGIFGSKTGSLTYVGAGLTVLALAVDPFAQQILTFPSRTVPALNATAFTQTSQQWYSIGGIDESNELSGIAPKLLASVMSGLLQTHNPLEPQCYATSCEFPEFFALGVCSKCEDVTAQTDQNCHVPEFPIFMDTLDPAFTEIPTNCSYQTPNNFSFDFEEFDDPRASPPDNVSFGMDHWSLRSRQIDPGFDIQSPVFDIQTPIGSFVAIDYSIFVTYTLSNTTVPPPKPSVTECAVYFCERQYAASTYLPGTKNSHPRHVNTQQLIPTDALDLSDPWDSKESVHFAPPNGFTLSKNSSYSIDRNTFNRLEDTMMSLFNSTTGVRGTMPRIDLSIMAPILRAGNLSQLLESMSTSLTDTLRTNPHSNEIPGKAFRDETFIHVRWPWIILPVVVTLGSIGLLLGTAIGSKQKKAVLWKCMVLPLLTSHLHTTPENDIAYVRSVDGMTDKSKKMRAVMVQDEEPLTFREK